MERNRKGSFPVHAGGVAGNAAWEPTSKSKTCPTARKTRSSYQQDSNIGISPQLSKWFL